MGEDASAGYDAIAEHFMAARSMAGRALVQAWARSLPAGCSIIDVGSGFGEPLTSVLVEEGLSVWAIDASPTLVDAFRARLPDVEIACEAAESSRFFGRTFGAALMVGLIFLLPEERQRALVHRLSHVLEPEGRVLFSAPRQIGTWRDILTGEISWSLGAEAYEDLLEQAGFRPVGSQFDETGTHYYEAQRR